MNYLKIWGLIIIQRKVNSFRSLKWIKRNSLNYESCCDYVVSLCKDYFKFNNFKIDLFNDDENALWITYGLNSYIIFVSKENVSLMLFEKDKNNIKQDKYHYFKKFTGDACWYNCLSWIKNRI